MHKVLQLNINAHYRLHACNHIVKGAKRSNIVDVQRQNLHFVPNDLNDLLQRMADEKLLLVNLLDEHGSEDQSIIIEYFTMLMSKELIWECPINLANNFPALQLHFHSPFELENAILDFNKHSNYCIDDALKELMGMKCRQIQIRDFDGYHFMKIYNVLESLTDEFLLSIHLLTPFQQKFQSQIETLSRNPRINKLWLHSAPIDIVDLSALSKVEVFPQEVSSSDHCGFVSPTYFTPNLGQISRSESVNTCLYKKISIDVDGQWCNCPAMPDKFGALGKIKIADILGLDKFKENWHIVKDQITVCKECEFRTICTDCRAFTLDPSKANAKPAKCDYSPYTLKWG